MKEMGWYRVCLIVPGTDGDAENGPCEPLWWTDMEQASNKDAAIRQADEKARRQWEEPNYDALGVEAPSDRELGQECPVCVWAEAVTAEEYAEWKRELDKSESLLNDEMRRMGWFLQAN